MQISLSVKSIGDSGVCQRNCNIPEIVDSYVPLSEKLPPILRQLPWALREFVVCVPWRLCRSERSLPPIADLLGEQFRLCSLDEQSIRLPRWHTFLIPIHKMRADDHKIYNFLLPCDVVRID